MIQGLFNSNKLPQLLEDFGTSLTREAYFRGHLADLASAKLIPIIREVLADPAYQKVADERYDFLRTKEVFRRCMDLAAKKHGWTRRTL